MLLRLLSALALVVAAAPARAQSILIPHSSIVRAEDAGIRMHTNHQILLDPTVTYTSTSGFTPSQLLSFYNMPASGGHDVIAVVDAFDYSSALNDFNHFSGTFGLPSEESSNVLASTNLVFQVVYASGSRPNNSNASDPSNPVGWNQEAAVDIEWAHAMAPNAKIVLVEANSDSRTDLFEAAKFAAGIADVKEISMSWATIEFPGETNYDSYFNISGPVFFASAGDTPAVVSYPACSPYVVAVGGTHIDYSSGTFQDETAWIPGKASDGTTIIGGGGGNSVYETKPVWQDFVTMMGSNRGTPDISSDADPNTGVSIYCANSWMVVGGTSVSAPCLAGMVNATSNGTSFTSTTQFLTTIYANYLMSTYPFRDIILGNSSTTQSPQFAAGVGWDYATGLGTPQTSASFTPYAYSGSSDGTVAGQDVLDMVANFGTANLTLEPTGDSTVSQRDIDFFLLQLGW